MHYLNKLKKKPTILKISNLSITNLVKANAGTAGTNFIEHLLRQTVSVCTWKGAKAWEAKQTAELQTSLDTQSCYQTSQNDFSHSSVDHRDHTHSENVRNASEFMIYCFRFWMDNPEAAWGYFF